MMSSDHALRTLGLVVFSVSACQPTTRRPQGTGDARGAASAMGHMHDPNHPSVDCPLRKAGIDAGSLRPFEDVEKYIAFLDRSDRAAWQRPEAVVGALGLTGRETVVDVGAGSGYFTFPIARALPGGRVIAMDIDPEMIRHIHHRVKSEGLENVEAVIGKADDPGIPSGVDVVFVCDVLHHVAGREAWMGKLAAAMKSGARLVLVEFKQGHVPEGPPEAMKIPRDRLLALATGAGLAFDHENTDLLPYQVFLAFRKP